MRFRLVRNDTQTLLRRQALANGQLDYRRNHNAECGYPETIATDDYQQMFDREGVGTRVVTVFPEETWAADPDIYEDEDTEVETPFEEDWDVLQDQHNLLALMLDADILAGVGQYGIIFLGLDDGKDFSQPVDGVATTPDHMPTVAKAPSTPQDAAKAKQAPKTNLPTANAATPQRRLLYARALPQSVVQVAEWEYESRNERYGQPVMYNITFDESFANVTAQPTAPGEVGPGGTAPTAGTAPGMKSLKVHWTRVIHIADNCLGSTVLGTPRQKPVWNRLLDIRKVLGGSAEMFWKGGFPGLSVEVNPDLEDVEFDKEGTKAELEAYSNGLQRYLALEGMTAKSLAPQVADPEPHFTVLIKAICITLGVPYRVFMGTEEGKLAGEQDSDAWDGRIARRQKRFATPRIVRPLVDRLIAASVMRPPADGTYRVKWPDRNAQTDGDKADVATKQTDALAKYVGGGVDVLIPPAEYLSLILGMDKNVVDQIIKAATDHIGAAHPDTPPDEIVPGRNPTPPPLEGVEPDGKPLPGGPSGGGAPTGAKKAPSPKGPPGTKAT